MTATVVVAGALANKAGSGGEAWVRLSWIRGLQRLGLDVWFAEQLAGDDGDRVAYFTKVVDDFKLSDRSALLGPHGTLAGVSVDLLRDLAADATLVNISGHLDHPDLFPAFRRRVYVDIDPGFTQAWHVAGDPGARLAGHDQFFTIAERIGQPDCPIPQGGLAWRTVRQPVVLDDWPVTRTADADRFTTVGSWRGPFGPVTFDGQTFGLKVHEFRRFSSVPTASGHHFEIALDIHPGDDADRQRLLENGWQLVDPRRVASTPEAFRRYVQASGAEFSVAQGVYVGTNSGWFSDRTVRYLASGKPALVQDTGIGRTLCDGLGLVPFRTLAEAVQAADDIVVRYDEHAEAARAVAETCFDSDRVLARFCEECGIG